MSDVIFGSIKILDLLYVIGGGLNLNCYIGKKVISYGFKNLVNLGVKIFFFNRHR